METMRLRKILDITKRVEIARKGELSNARYEQDQALHALEQKRREERDQLTALAEAGELNVHSLLDQARMLAFAAEQTHRARTQYGEAGQEVERRETASFEATRDVRKFEVLFDRDREQQRIVRKNAEQQTLDETRRTPPRRGT